MNIDIGYCRFYAAGKEMENSIRYFDRYHASSSSFDVKIHAVGSNFAIK